MSLFLEGYGNYLGSEKFDFVIRKKNEITKVKPFYSVKEIRLSFGNYVSTKALAWASIYGIKGLVTSQSGRPLGVFLPLNYDLNVKTRIKQYEAYYARADDLSKCSFSNYFLQFVFYQVLRQG